MRGCGEGGELVSDGEALAMKEREQPGCPPQHNLLPLVLQEASGPYKEVEEFLSSVQIWPFLCGGPFPRRGKQIYGSAQATRTHTHTHTTFCALSHLRDLCSWAQMQIHKR